MPHALSGFGIVVALDAEARTLGVLTPASSGRFESRLATVAVSGPGPERAARAAEALLHDGARGLVSWGLAGGLEDTLSRGALLIPTALANDAGELIDLDAALQAALMSALTRLQPRAKTIVTVAAPVGTSAAKRQLAARTGAVAVDMESHAVAMVARRHGVPCAAVRAVVDTVDLDIPTAAIRAMRTDGSVRVPALAVGLIRQPAKCLPLWHLALGYRAATRTLKAAAKLLENTPHRTPTAG